MADQRIVITGAAGSVASLLRPRLARPGRVLRLLDIREPIDVVAEREEFVAASIDDLDAMTRACEGADAVVHLGGQSKEAPAEDVLRLNALGSYCVLEAARRAGPIRAVMASSSHVAGFYEHPGTPDGIPGDAPARPDTLYGWSKAAVEAAGRLFVDRFGMDVICLRIGMWAQTPPGPRGLSLWLSPDDGARLIEASLAADQPGFRLVWGISRNTRRWLSLADGEAIGYHPKDDAETFADQVFAEYGEQQPGSPVMTRLGGSWCEIPLGERRQPGGWLA